MFLIINLTVKGTGYKIMKTVKYKRFGKEFEGKVLETFSVETTGEQYYSLECIYSGKKFSAPVKECY